MKTGLERILCRWPGLYLTLLRITGRASLEKRAFLALIRPGETVLDIGANRGYFTRLFSWIAGRRGAVHAFEPQPGTFAILRTAMDRAGRPPNVTLNLCALGDTNGPAILHQPEGDDGQASLRTHRDGSWTEAPSVHRYDCQVRTLDEYAAKMTRLDFIKCDVEGAEMLVVRGGRATLKRLAPLLWLESNPDWTRGFGYTPEHLVAELRSLGYDRFFSAGETLAPLTDAELARGTNLLCAVSRVHASRLAALDRI
jgi:FkbM family methyltransferase